MSDELRETLRRHHPIMRSETGPFSGCRCGAVRLGQDVIAHVVAELSSALLAERDGHESQMAELGTALDYTRADLEHVATERDRAERERDELAAKVAAVRELAESWRYKGEYGWGSWQEGDGPDEEGTVLDGVATDIRRALGDPS